MRSETEWSLGLGLCCCLLLLLTVLCCPELKAQKKGHRRNLALARFPFPALRRSSTNISSLGSGVPWPFPLFCYFIFNFSVLNFGILNFYPPPGGPLAQQHGFHQHRPTPGSAWLCSPLERELSPCPFATGSFDAMTRKVVRRSRRAAKLQGVVECWAKKGKCPASRMQIADQLSRLRRKGKKGERKEGENCVALLQYRRGSNMVCLPSR